MSSDNIGNKFKIELLHSPSINTGLGLKYFNNNHDLYIKILNSFVKRNETLDLKILNKNELSTTLHTLKGLSSTLGMESLSAIIHELEKKSNTILMDNFSRELTFIIHKIKNII